MDDFNEWEEIWGQGDYESRLHTEAELMVALEALREDLVELDHDLDDLDSCISSNDDGISDNDHRIHENDHEIEHNDDEISDQENRVKRLQRQCRRVQEDLDTDRDFLVLHCQQFAFAKVMVPACADILTCTGTNLAYRADIFNGNHYGRTHVEKTYNAPEYYDHERTPEVVHVEPSSHAPLTPGHYTQEDVAHDESHHGHHDHGHGHEHY